MFKVQNLFVSPLNEWESGKCLPWVLEADHSSVTDVEVKKDRVIPSLYFTSM
jgi:hypothetical protein